MPGLFHLAAYTASLNSATPTKVTPATDQFLQSVVNTNFYALPEGLKYVLAHAGIGATISRQRLDAPGMYPVLPEFLNLNVSAEPSNPPNINEMFEQPLRLKNGEALAFDSVNAAGGAEQNHVLAWLGYGMMPTDSPPSDLVVRPMRFTGVATLVANTWSPVSPSFTYQPPAGVYGIVGMRASSLGCVAARIVPQDGGARPGVIGNDAASDLDFRLFRQGRLGNGQIWATFSDLTPPIFEFLSVSADTAETIILDVVRLGDRPGAVQ